MALPRSVLLIISGSVSAYKSLELIRLLRAQSVVVHTILTRGGAQFVTPLAVSSLTGTKTYHDQFSLTDEVEMGHIQLSRIADIVLIAPASADLLAKMANGIADDLATTALLATNKPVIVAPAMNHKMWHHPATQRNLAQLRADGVQVIDPTEGDMACGEFGIGRLAEPKDIVAALQNLEKPITELPTLGSKLFGKHAIVTSGPTHEPIDPVRFIGNHSSGKQGHAIASALAAAGARVTLISGPTRLPDPAGIKVVHITTGEEMLRAAEAALPADIFVGAAAVADWKPSAVAEQKIKKQAKLDMLSLDFLPTSDILAAMAQHAQRPALVVGFAAETEHLRTHAKAKRMAKGADWMLGNDVSRGIFGNDENEILFLTKEGEDHWPRMSKREVAEKLTGAIATHFATPPKRKGKAS
jgi:phosphopantothenoylcysteine decarboxylase/phosphopantothenate--cysteine ligase